MGREERVYVRRGGGWAFTFAGPKEQRTKKGARSPIKEGGAWPAPEGGKNHVGCQMLSIPRSCRGASWSDHE